MKNFSTVEALLNLLGDDDQQIVNKVGKHLLEIGPEALPLLKSELNNQPPPVKERLSELLELLEPASLHGAFRNLADKSGGEPLDLQKSLLTVARIGFPDLSAETVENQLAELAQLIAAELARWKALDDHTVVKLVSDVLFDQFDYSGPPSARSENPNHSYINWVLERKTGSALALCSLVKLLADRLNLNFGIIGLPVHTVLKYQGDEQVIFLDPYHSGKLLTREDCEEFLLKTGFKVVDEYLFSLSNKQVILLLLEQLINLYQRLGNSQRVKELRSYHVIVDRRY